MRRIRLPFLAAALSTSFVTAPAHAKPPITFTGSFTGTIVTQMPGSCGPNQVDVHATFSGLFSPFGAAATACSARATDRSS